MRWTLSVTLAALSGAPPVFFLDSGYFRGKLCSHSLPPRCWESTPAATPPFPCPCLPGVWAAAQCQRQEAHASGDFALFRPFPKPCGLDFSHQITPNPSSCHHPPSLREESLKPGSSFALKVARVLSWLDRKGARVHRASPALLSSPGSAGGVQTFRLPAASSRAR